MIILEHNSPLYTATINYLNTHLTTTVWNAYPARSWPESGTYAEVGNVEIPAGHMSFGPGLAPTGRQGAEITAGRAAKLQNTPK